MSNETQATILRLVGYSTFMAGVLQAVGVLNLPERITPLDLYALGIWLSLGAMSMQIAGKD